MDTKSKFLLLIILLVAGVAYNLHAQQSAKADSIDKYMSVRTDMGKFSGAVLVAQDGNVILRKGYGYADVEDKVPFTPETPFEIASISKMFTAMAVLKLRDAGKLKPEDLICNYVDDCPDAWRTITVQNLMRHTSGIPDYEEALDFGSGKYFDLMTQLGASKQIFENAKKQPLDFKPGEKFKYSNTGYIVLGFIVQKAAGEPFNKYITDNILKPAGLKHSGVLGTAEKPQQLAYGYTFGDIGWEKTVSGYPLTSGHLKKLKQLALNPPEGDAGLYSNIDDLNHWSNLMDGSSFIQEALAKEIFTPGTDAYGYGWIIDNVFGMKRLSHSGMLPGYTSELIKFPDSKTTIVILCNLDRALINRIVRDITAILYDKPYDMPVRGKLAHLTPAQITSLEGEYKNSNGTVLSVKNTPEFLTAAMKGRFTAGLIALSPTEFYFPLADGKVIFTLGESGKAVKVNLRMDGEDHFFSLAN